MQQGPRQRLLSFSHTSWGISGGKSELCCLSDKSQAWTDEGRWWQQAAARANKQTRAFTSLLISCVSHLLLCFPENLIFLCFTSPPSLDFLQTSIFTSLPYFLLCFPVFLSSTLLIFWFCVFPCLTSPPLSHFLLCLLCVCLQPSASFGFPLNLISVFRPLYFPVFHLSFFASQNICLYTSCFPTDKISVLSFMVRFDWIC